MYRLLSQCATQLANLLALTGGLLLILIITLTCISILGRSLLPLNIGAGPIPGIYEITEMGVAAAVFAFLPWCQLQRGHATVNLLKPLYGKRLNRLIDLIADCGMLLIAAIGSHRLYLGMLDKQGYGETTLILQAPVWLAYAASLVGMLGFTLVAAFCVLRAIRQLYEVAPGERDE